MKRRNLRLRGLAFADECDGPLLHLAHCFVRERHGEDPFRLDARANQLRDAERHDARLARSCAARTSNGPVSVRTASACGGFKPWAM